MMSYHVTLSCSHLQGEKDKSAGDTSDASDMPPASQTSSPDPTVAPPTSSPAAATNVPPVPPTSPFANMTQFNPNMYRMPFPAPGMSPPGYPGISPPEYPGISPPGYTGARPPMTEAQRWPLTAGAPGNLMYWPYANNHVRPTVDNARTTVDAAPSTGSDTNPTMTTPTVTPSSPPAATVTQSPTPVTSLSSSNGNTTPNTTTESGVRQRARTVTRAPTLIGQTAELPPVRSAKDGDRILLILTVIVGLLLVALVMRRLLKVANVF